MSGGVWSNVISVMTYEGVAIFLYACETGTSTAELQRRIQSLEFRCFRKILHNLASPTKTESLTSMCGEPS